MGSVRYALLAVSALVAAGCTIELGGERAPAADAPLVLVAPVQHLEQGPPRGLEIALSGIEGAVRSAGLRVLPLRTGFDLYREQALTAAAAPGAFVQLGAKSGADAILFVSVVMLRTEDPTAEYDLAWELLSTVDERILFEDRRRGFWRPPQPTVDPTSRARIELDPAVIGGEDEPPQTLAEHFALLHRAVLSRLPPVPRAQVR